MKGVIACRVITPFLLNRLRLPLDWLTFKMASATTSDFVRTSSRTDAPPFSMLEQRGLIGRLADELRRAARECARDPRGFIRDLLFEGQRDTKRHRLIRIGLLYALGAHLALIGIIVILGWNRVGVSAGEQTEYTVTILPTSPNPHGNSGALNGERPRGEEDGGGGGGGNKNPLPASGGALPQMSPAQQVVHPLSPSSPRPVLPVPATIVGPQSDAPPPTATMGIPTGDMDAPPSPGQGTGGGIGSGSGTGAGSGTGPGAGPGSGGGEGGGNRAYGSPNGTNVTGPIDWRRPPRDGGYKQFTWVRRVRAIVTPEAQANKVAGVVLLRATFRVDGTITDIQVVNPVPFMTEAAIEALKRSRFKPATYNGVPVTVTNVLIKEDVYY